MLQPTRNVIVGFLIAAALPACGPGGTTTVCGAERCVIERQYCELTVNAAGATTASRCQPIPSGCGVDLCQTCLMGLPNQQACSADNSSGAWSYTVRIRP